ncbi:ABC transporter G family member 21, partial [Nephila pilipes]
NDAPSLWSVSQESVDPQGSDLLGMEDDKKMNSVYSKVDTRDDDDSGRSSWSEVSSSAFSSEMDLNEENKWPTSFRTQLTVLTARNFKEARKRMLSLLNWVQTLALSLITGAVWFQIKRTEENIFNMLGYKFFVITYWMLFSLFGALMSFPPEREVVYKERISGAYRLSAYYISKMCGELSLVATLPTVFFAISYPMMGCSSFEGYIFMWLNLMLSTLVSQSVGLFIGALCIDLQKAVTASALFSLSTMLFGGFYASELAPSLSWVPYTSIVHYAYQNMQIIHFQYGEPIRCAANNSAYESCRRENSTGFISPEELIGEDALPLWANTVILFLYLVAFRLVGYYVLRFVRRPR